MFICWNETDNFTITIVFKQDWANLIIWENKYLKGSQHNLPVRFLRNDLEKVVRGVNLLAPIGNQAPI